MNVRRHLAGATLLATLLAPPTIGNAATAPVQAQYGNPTAVAGVASTSVSPTTGGGVGDLPFTGAELGLLAIAGVAIGASGLALRKVGASGRRRTRTDAPVDAPDV